MEHGLARRQKAHFQGHHFAQRHSGQVRLDIHSKEKPKFRLSGQELGIRRYFATNSGVGEALQQDSQCCAASRRGAAFDARLEQIMACLQMCRQHVAAKKDFFASVRKESP